MIAVGVDVAEAKKGLDVVAIGSDRRIVASWGRLSLEDVAALVNDEIRPQIVCVDSPSGWSKSGSSRQAERELAKMRISSFATGADPGDHSFYRWMRVGFALFAAIADRYPLFEGDEPSGRAAEVFPHASSVLLAGRAKTQSETKVQFRRKVLRSRGIDESALPSIDRVDAALAALTGLLALEKKWTWVGDPLEGVILLPKQRPEPLPAGVSPTVSAAGPLERRASLRRRPSACGGDVGTRYVVGKPTVMPPATPPKPEAPNRPVE